MADAAAYAGLFVAAFLAATIIPAQSELVLAGMISTGRYDLPTLLAVATAGNSLGSLANWMLGRLVERFRDRTWFPLSPGRLKHAERRYRRWGKWSLLLSWAPVIGDALTLVAGVLRVRLIVFLPLVVVAKGGRYLVVAWAVVAAKS